MIGEMPARLVLADGRDIAYYRTRGIGPGVVFMGGFRSDMTGGKAVALEDFCRRTGRAFLRFDYTGHGRSSGEFEDGTIGGWAADAVDAMDRLTDGPQVVVGSSMGGWIALLAALRRPARVAGLVGIAAAPDFTEELMWAGMDGDTRAVLQRDGAVSEPSDYDDTPNVITFRLIEDGRRHLLLDRPIAIHCPVRLLHGMRDDSVPWSTAPRIAEKLLSEDVRVLLIKDGDHRLSRDQDIVRLCATVNALCEEVGTKI